MSSFVSSLQRPKKGVVVEPVCLGAAELLIRWPQIGARSVTKIAPGAFDQRSLKNGDSLVVDETERPSQSLARKSPSSIRASGLISSQFPAKDDSAW